MDIRMRQEITRLLETVSLLLVVLLTVTLVASAQTDRAIVVTDKSHYDPWDTVSIIITDTSESTAWIIDPKGREILLELVPSDSGYTADYSPQQAMIPGTYTVVVIGPQVNDTCRFEITTTGNLTINTSRKMYEAGQLVELSVISPQGIPVVRVTDPMGNPVDVAVSQNNGVYRGTFRPDRQIILGEYQAVAETYASGSKEHGQTVFAIYAPVKPPAVSLSSGVEFFRELSGPRTGQHKVPPETNIHITITVNLEGSLYNTNLVDYFPKDWIVTNPNNGIVSTYDAHHNMITWPVSVNGSVTRWYSIESPQRTKPPTSYNFFTGLGGNASGLWKVTVADPTNTYYFHPETMNVGGDGIQKVANITDNTGDTNDDDTAGPLYSSGDPNIFTAPSGFRFYTDPVFSSPITFTSDTIITMWFENNYNDSSNGPIRYRAIIYDYDPATGSTISLGSDEQDYTYGHTQLTFTIPTGNRSVTGGHRLAAVFQVNGTDRTDDYQPAIVYDSITNNSRMTFSYGVDTLPPGTPAELILFTDKKVYSDHIFSQNRKVQAPATDSVRAADLRFWIYAIVLDESGNILKNRTITGTLNDEKQFDHYTKGVTTHHSDVGDPNYFSGVFTLVDDGSVTGDSAGDGIYTAIVDPTDSTDKAVGYPTIIEDEILINITVTDAGIGTKNTYVLYAGTRCHGVPSHGSHATATAGSDNCAVCHHGYEHFFENKSGTIPDSMRNVHSLEMTEPDILWDDKGFGNYNWNTTFFNSVAGFTGSNWKNVIPGSGYCAACHRAVGPDLKDYGGATRTTANLADRPGCSGFPSYYVTCHVNTRMQNTQVPEWSSSAAVTTDYWNYDISVTRSHNSSSNTSGEVPCAGCHGSTHALTMPNMSADISGSGNINDQCYLCHSDTGPENSLKYTHDSRTDDCRVCHLDSSKALDVHYVFGGEIPNPNCSQCHDLGGMAFYLIDYNSLNKSDHVHNQFTVSEGKYPLNYNASNGSATRPADDRLCWACHGEDDNGDGIANYSEQPASDHPVNYRTPHACEDCHQNASAPWNAPQIVAHSNATAVIWTPGAPYCYDCHGDGVMYNRSHQDDDYYFNLKNSNAAHYGTGFPELKALQGTNSYCIRYCHQNITSPFRDVFVDPAFMEIPNHSARTSRPQNQSCVAAQCHTATVLHDASLRKPTLESGQFGNANCTAIECHDPAIYRNHNNIVNCISCHMDNSGPNIHPIKYLQNNGRDFAQMNYTAADCNLCHK
ncbi:MAG: hypothetical protein M8353_04760, partial [ANME-2 cluster archaeon]|nr:hypothetical protein [ANME-2 cluster archaeon]